MTPDGRSWTFGHYLVSISGLQVIDSTLRIWIQAQGVDTGVEFDLDRLFEAAPCPARGDCLFPPRQSGDAGFARSFPPCRTCRLTWAPNSASSPGRFSCSAPRARGCGGRYGLPFRGFFGAGTAVVAASGALVAVGAATDASTPAKRLRRAENWLRRPSKVMQMIFFELITRLSLRAPDACLSAFIQVLVPADHQGCLVIDLIAAEPEQENQNLARGCRVCEPNR